MKRTAESMLWGFFCTSSWTWCIGMYLPFILLRLWGWPGFWSFFIPNVLGCTLFGFVLTRERSRALMQRLGPVLILFSAFTVAYQCYFAGWAAHTFFVRDGGLTTVAATGVPILVLLAACWLAVRGDQRILIAAGAALVLALGAVVWAVAPASDIARAPLVPLPRLVWAIPTIVAGFLLCPFLDLTFHRALQAAPQPRVAFVTFGASFALMLLAVSTLYDPATGTPRVSAALAVVWGVQLVFTVAVHLRELWSARGDHPPAWGMAAMVAFAVLLATPAFAFSLGPPLPEFSLPLFGGTMHALLPGEPLYLAFLGAYGLLFPALLWFGGWHRARTGLWVVLAIGVPCYLLGAWNFATFLMPVPLLVALVFRSARHPAAQKAPEPVRPPGF